MSLVILAMPWRMHSQAVQQQLGASERILFFDGSVAGRDGDLWTIICYACDKAGEAGDFVNVYGAGQIKRLAT